MYVFLCAYVWGGVEWTVSTFRTRAVLLSLVTSVLCLFQVRERKIILPSAAQSPTEPKTSLIYLALSSTEK